mgnify:CR=1 FL=1
MPKSVNVFSGCNVMCSTPSVLLVSICSCSNGSIVVMLDKPVTVYDLEVSLRLYFASFAAMCVDCINDLAGCEMHSTRMLLKSDEDALRKIKVNLALRMVDAGADISFVSLPVTIVPSLSSIAQAGSPDAASLSSAGCTTALFAGLMPSSPIKSSIRFTVARSTLPFLLSQQLL